MCYCIKFSFYIHQSNASLLGIILSTINVDTLPKIKLAYSMYQLTSNMYHVQ